MDIYKEIARKYNITAIKAKQICEMPFEDCIKVMDENVDNKFIYNGFFKMFVKPKRKEYIEKAKLSKINNTDE